MAALIDLFRSNFNGRLAYSVILISLSSGNYGFDNQGFSAAQAMQEFAKQFGYYDPTTQAYALEAYFLSLYSSVIWIGFGVGLIVGSSISARYGRKVGMISLSVWAIVCATIIVSSFSKWQILVGRILFNGYLGMELAVLPVYQSESVPAPVRSLVTSTYQFSQQVGGLIMNLVALGTQHIPNNSSWRILFGLFYIVPSIVLAGIYWVPESPRWLLTKGRRDEAFDSLRKLRQGKRTMEEISAELESIEIALREEPEQGRWREIWYRDNIRRTMIAIGINFFQEMSGQAITSKFGALVVADIGTIDPFVITVTFAVIGIVTVACVMLLSDKWGRRPFLLASMTVMSCAAFGLGAIGCYDWTTNLSFADAAIALLVIFSFGFSLGYAPLTNTVMSEVPSLRLRDMTVRTAGWARVVANFIVGFTLPYEIDSIGLKLGFIYGPICLIAIIWTFFFVPECKGKSLEVVEYLFQQKVPTRQFRRWKDLEILKEDGSPADTIHPSSDIQIEEEKDEVKSNF